MSKIVSSGAGERTVEIANILTGMADEILKFANREGISMSIDLRIFASTGQVLTTISDASQARQEYLSGS